ncbi:hypothetical protein PS907_01739 [Pseudomonas fluorescens]|nr:hypothetical protein PS907_01739 [Pseudomonas fluorescens]
MIVFCEGRFKLRARMLLLIALWNLPLACYSAGHKNTNLDLDTYKDFAQLRLESTRDILQKDIQAISSRLDFQDKRLDTQNSHIDQNLSLLGILLSALGVLLPLAGLAGYISVSRKARSEAQIEAQKAARKEAKITANEWFDAHANELQVRLDALQKNMQELEDQAEAGFNIHIQRVQDGADLAIKEMQLSIHGQTSLNTHISENAASALSKAATAAKNKPESQYTYIDWNNRAFDAYRKGEIERAVRFWRDAADDESATPIQAASALANAGSAMGEINRHDQSIEIYNELLKRFDGKGIEGMESLIATALNGKAGSLGLLGLHDEADVLLDIIIDRLEKRETFANSEYMAHAITNKVTGLVIREMDDEALKHCNLFLDRFGGKISKEIANHLITIRGYQFSILSRQKRQVEAENVYDRTILQFDYLDDPEIKSEMGKLKNGKAFILICQAKERWSDYKFRTDSLHQADMLLNEIPPSEVYFPIILGNQAYCTFLLGHNENSVREKLIQGLKLGGANLYEGTIKDTLINPVPEKDNDFKVLVDEIWESIRTQSDTNV